MLLLLLVLLLGMRLGVVKQHKKNKKRNNSGRRVGKFFFPDPLPDGRTDVGGSQGDGQVGLFFLGS